MDGGKGTPRRAAVLCGISLSECAIAACTAGAKMETSQNRLPDNSVISSDSSCPALLAQPSWA